MTASRYRRSLPLMLGGILLLETLAVTYLHLGVLRPIEQQRLQERLASLLRLDGPRVIIMPPPPRDPFQLLADRTA